ncbi:hypothetical protein TEQG_02483 [Trichophyton equinum CBS 127.97]|uniref:Uncharacterized protein n=1 Tax=Trichophyton equinum (strain ATCC MYA-4606 / CBS 127.97) TaxID=559882 RepID=F2PNH9_TRIEC|nr:hypothetical protein TEQG_02483 [Trichophyton equinum CBS 127.97]
MAAFFLNLCFPPVAELGGNSSWRSGKRELGQQRYYSPAPMTHPPLRQSLNISRDLPMPRPPPACSSLMQTSLLIGHDQDPQSPRPAPHQHILAETNGPTSRFHGGPMSRGSWQEWRDRIFGRSREFLPSWTTKSKGSEVKEESEVEEESVRKIVSCTRPSPLDFKDAVFFFAPNGEDTERRKFTIGEVAEGYWRAIAVMKMFPDAMDEIKTLR